MIQNIPYSFNKMAAYKQPSSPVSPIPTSDLIWFLDFSNGLTQPYSQITGTNNISSNTSIQTDSQLGYYLQCTKTTQSRNGIIWQDSQSYLNNYFNGTNDFSVSFWLRAPSWNSHTNNVVLGWKNTDRDTGLVIYRDGYSTKVNARLSLQYNFFTTTNAAENSDWNHWVFVRDSNGATWYCNGNVDNTESTFGDKSNVASQNFMIGYCPAWSCRAYFDVTKIRIYNRVLTSSEVEILYTNKA